MVRLRTAENMHVFILYEHSAVCYEIHVKVHWERSVILFSYEYRIF